jgi:RNA polymerase sigma-70 factor (ECF subfamily)
VSASEEIVLIQQLSRGSISAFDTFYHQYNRVVYANIAKMVKQPEAAEDLLQEVFIALWQNRHKLKQDRSVAGWLFVVSYNKAATYLKQQLKSAIVLVPEENYPEIIPQDEPLEEELYQTQLAIVEAAINQLPARKKEVFRLCRLEGRPYEEVALTLGISVTSVKDYLKQSVRFIREYAQEHPPATGMTTLSLIVALTIW